MNLIAFAELVQYLDEIPLSLMLPDTKDNAREALRILRTHYAQSGKPRIITLYNQLTNFKKSHGESITDYIIWVGNTVTTPLLTER